MLRQAVQTLTGRSAEDVNPYEEDDIYLRGEQTQDAATDPNQDGPTDAQDANAELVATVQRLVSRLDTVEGRVNEKDRYIGQLQGENRTLREGAAPQPSAGGAPQADPVPVLDNETAELFAQKYADNPVAALSAVADHIYSRSTEKIDQVNAVRDQEARNAQLAAAVERNILRQVDLAVNQYGDQAQAIVGDFIDLARQGNASPEQYANTWLGRTLMEDQALAQSTQGIARTIELEVLKRGATTDPEPTAQPAPYVGQPQAGVSRPAAPSRHVSANSLKNIFGR
jgi:hypothetical protein